MSSKEAGVEYWKRKAELYPDLMKAKPNPAHTSVAELHEMGLLDAVKMVKSTLIRVKS